ncbi:MAG: NifU family protein [Deltaproteobacteria bacterium]|nr:MAG: NifU family protein [Deltaproteobacteria bacterium]
MRFYIHVQETPNPDAVKFISQYTVKSEGKGNYRTREEGEHVPLVLRLFGLDGVQGVFLFDNYVTITRDPAREWDALSNEVIDLLQEALPEHDPDYSDPTSDTGGQSREDLTPELQGISDILDRTVRPYLAADGGGLDLIELRDHVLYIKYQGACGSCPSSAGGTLMAIQSILRDEFDPDLSVVDVGGAGDFMFSGY